MAKCGNCAHFHLVKVKNRSEKGKGRCDVTYSTPYSAVSAELCKFYKYEGAFDDELDGYLFENHQVKAGCRSSIETLKYDIAREVAEKMIKEFHINIQYISREERQKKMDEMYGLDLLNKED